MRPHNWFDALYQCQQHGQAYVLVTLLASAGSTPRNAGSKMVVTADSSFDTIGGGHLEYQVIAQARQWLLTGKEQQQIEHYPLSSKLGQCCGGAINVLYEVKTQHAQHLAVFGAGHVAKALMPILSQLPLQISWVDQRPELFADNQTASHIQIKLTDEPLEIIEQLPSNSWVLIMTHNHQLDFELVDAALKRSDIGYLGMIGSDTKARRFKTRLAHKGFSTEQIARLISPVGLTDIGGKKPIEVAVSIAAQLIQRLQPEPVSRQHQQKSWQQNQQLKALF
ncbi:xanthine dehydrogenase accessory protein XdhC [Neptunicella sp. SCSIO 80796]|uniref:xanthine dehydrogenase accessory protein XdhC n=1 Tax=Neptunicella plasticusilytica TaxID=3117012 RepID=UPI003A4DEB33